MVDGLENAQQRAEVARAVLDVLRLTRAAHSAADLEDAAIILGLLVGQAEGRPLTASDLSHYVGLPRPSIIRRLQRLASGGGVQSGRDGRRVVFWLADANRPRLVQAASKAARVLRAAAAKLDEKKPGAGAG